MGLRSKSLLLGLIGSVTLCGAASADLFAPGPVSGWTITLGVEGRAMPAFEGSSKTVFQPVPLIDIRRAGTPRRFQAPRDGASIGLFESGPFRFGATGKVRRGRDQSDEPELAGLGDVDWAIEVGAFAEYWLAPWLRTRLEVRRGFGGHEGVVADLSADVVHPISPRATLSAGPRVTFSSGDAMDPYFSITPAQAAASGLPAYSAAGGVQSAGVGTQLRYEWSPRWATHVFLEYERLMDDAADSPLVRFRGSPDQLTAGVGVTYSFDILTNR